MAPIEVQYKKIAQCIRSCENRNQLKGSGNMIKVFLKNYQRIAYRSMTILSFDMASNAVTRSRELDSFLKERIKELESTEVITSDPGDEQTHIYEA